MGGGGVVFAQAIPGNFVSPQNTATQGRFRSAADDFIRPDAYTGVTFEDWYGMASFASTNTATLGYAAKIGGLYIGAFYSGSFWAGVTEIESTESQGNWLGGTEKVTQYDAFTFPATGPSNQIAVLIGVADMGFRLSFITTHQIFNESNIIVGADPYKSYLTERGLISPQLAWSMTRNLTENGVKPWATFDLNFNRYYTKTAEYSNTGNGWAAEDFIVNSQNSFIPVFNVGLGGYTFADKDGWRFSADIEYRLQITVYDNEYNYYDANGANQIKSFSGTYNGNTGTLSEQSFSSHRIRPSVSTQWNGEKLRLRAKLDLNLSFSDSENNEMGLKSDYSGTLIKNGDSEETSVFSFNPALSLAAQWQIASGLFLNIGGSININALSITTAEGEEYVNGEAAANSSYKTVTPDFGNTSTQLSLGVTFNATDNLGFEAVSGIGANNAVSVFNTTTGMFVFGSVLVSLKF